MDMARIKKALNCYIDPDLHAWVDDWIAKQEHGANKTALVESLLRKFRSEQEAIDSAK